MTYFLSLVLIMFGVNMLSARYFYVLKYSAIINFGEYHTYIGLIILLSGFALFIEQRQWDNRKQSKASLAYKKTKIHMGSLVVGFMLIGTSIYVMLAGLVPSTKGMQIVEESVRLPIGASLSLLGAWLIKLAIRNIKS